MKVELTYDKEFSDILKSVEQEYGKELLEIEGLGDNLDTNKISSEYFSSSATVDVTVDPNANVDDNTVMGYIVESNKPYLRLNSLYKMWKTIRRLFGSDAAKKAIESQIVGDVYVHDMTGYGIRSYCWAMSIMDVVNLGLPFINRVHSKPAQHLTTFVQHVVQTVMFMSNQIDGAVAIPDLLIAMSYFVQKELDERGITYEEYQKDLRQQIQILVYTLNQPVRMGQSPYTNVTIYDKVFMEKMFSDLILPNGNNPDLELVDRIQWEFADVMEKEMNSQILTFPVITAAIAASTDEEGNRKVEDEEFIDKVAERLLPHANYNIYIGNTSALSSCCFRGDQTCLTKSSNGVNFMTFRDLANSKWRDRKQNFTIFHNGSWVKGKLVVTDYNKPMYSVKTSNKKEIIVTDDHIHATLDGDKETNKLTTNDYLLFNTNALDTFPEKDQNLTYEQGFMIGLFLGDGSLGTRFKDKDGNELAKEVAFSLNINCYKKCMKLIDIAAKNIGSNNKSTCSTPYNNVYPVRISGSENSKFIKAWTTGNRSWLKSINPDVLLQSAEFRKGILHGLYESDGGNSNRIYTTSTKLVEDIEMLCTSLGINTIIDISDRTDEKVIIRGEKYNRNYPLYCVRFYISRNKRSMTDVYIYQNNSLYFKVKSITEIDPDETVYDFEMNNQNEPYFTLPNGIITHNCRLRNDMESKYMNSFGATDSMKIGSHRVCTVNLPRLALTSSTEEELFINLESAMETAYRILKSHRYIVRDIIHRGKLPLYSINLMDINRQFSTFGIIGIYEMAEMYGVDPTSEEGLNFMEKVLDFINRYIEKANQVIEDKMYIIRFRDGSGIMKVVDSKVAVIRGKKKVYVNVSDLKYNDMYKNKRIHKVEVVEEKVSYVYNVEQVPGESAAPKLLRKDRIVFDNVKDLEKYELYSNQFIPLHKDINIADRMRIHGRFDDKTTGGAILHINVAERIDNKEVMKKMINHAIESGVIYFAINYNFQECEEHHFTVGSSRKCPVCNSEIIEEYTRVVGFITPKKNWSQSRKDEKRTFLTTKSIDKIQ